jgi:hypothetical protein
MGSSYKGNLVFTALREQPNKNECWMKVYNFVNLESGILFYVKYLGNTWEEHVELMDEKASIIQNFWKSIPKCITCRIIITKKNTCYFCEQNYCDFCCPDFISYTDCEVCGLNYCYRNYRYSDGYCKENKRMHSGCWNCGN